MCPPLTSFTSLQDDQAVDYANNSYKRTTWAQGLSPAIDVGETWKANLNLKHGNRGDASLDLGMRTISVSLTGSSGELREFKEVIDL